MPKSGAESANERVSKFHFHIKLIHPIPSTLWQAGLLVEEAAPNLNL